MKVYPNPSRGRVNVQLVSSELSLNQEDPLRISVYTVGGRLIATKDVQSSDLEYEFDLSSFGKGSYYIHLIGADFIETKTCFIE